MQTAIGRRLDSPHRRLAAGVIAVLVVTADFLLVLWRDYPGPWQHYPESIEGRGSLALAALAATVWLVQGDLPSVGFVLPKKGVWYWARLALLIGLAVGACFVVGMGAWVLSGQQVPVYSTDPSTILDAFLRMCVFVPILEETIYRLVLCVLLCACLGPWKSIVVSGLAFAFLHVAYGNPSPENLVGGFFLAWAYLKSESILVPLALHGLGNLVALASQIGTWYWLRYAV